MCDEIVFLGPSGLGTLLEGSKKNKELDNDVILKETKTYQDFEQNIPINGNGYAKSVSLDGIKENDFSLLPGAYIEIKEDEKRSESEIKSELKKKYFRIRNSFQRIKRIGIKIKRINQF